MKKEATVNVKRGSLTVSINGRFVYSFDKAGRLYSAYIDGHTFLRGLDHKVIEKWRSEDDPLAPKFVKILDEGERRGFIERILWDMREVKRAFGKQSVEVILVSDVMASSKEEAAAWLEKIAAWSAEAYARDRDKFLSVYKPVSVLPPDQYLAVVLQITEGCPWNKCAFCDFYHDRRFRIKNDPEVRRHIKAVKSFFGDSASLRKSIFLADANALVVPQGKLLGIFEAINEEFRIAQPGPGRTNEDGFTFDGIYSFVDAYSALRKTAQDFAELRQRHLKRVYLGVETGCDELLRLVNKLGKAEEALEVVSHVKAAGVHVGVIVLIGLGGDAFFDRHAQKTVELLNEMKLGQGDIIYLSPLYVHPGSDYERKAQEHDIQPLDYSQMKHQMQIIRAGLRFPTAENLPKITTYDVREFIY